MRKKPSPIRVNTRLEIRRIKSLRTLEGSIVKCPYFITNPIPGVNTIIREFDFDKSRGYNSIVNSMKIGVEDSIPPSAGFESL
jgi:hypothetical protein